MEMMQSYFSNVFSGAVPALIAWLLLFLCMRKDRSRYRNCYLFAIAALLSVPVVTSLAGPLAGYVNVLLLLLTGLLVLTVPVLLIINGIQMMKKEGHSLKHALSLGLGLAMALAEISSFAFLLVVLVTAAERQVRPLVSAGLFRVLLVLVLSVFYFSVSFLIFMLYTLFLQVVPRKRDFDYVIILGAGLIHGDQVSKLLADRLDKAIEIYRKDPTPPIMVPSGGQGGDETISEGEAMAKYLREHGIPEEYIVPETESKNTMENLVNSQKIIEERGGRQYTALVTSNYHVYRALRHCRRIGFSCTGIGAHVAGYYWPSALIREYIAIHTEKKHMAVLLLGWLILIGLPMLALMQ